MRVYIHVPDNNSSSFTFSINKIGTLASLKQCHPFIQQHILLVSSTTCNSQLSTQHWLLDQWDACHSVCVSDLFPIVEMQTHAFFHHTRIPYCILPSHIILLTFGIRSFTGSPMVCQFDRLWIALARVL